MAFGQYNQELAEMERLVYEHLTSSATVTTSLFSAQQPAFYPSVFRPSGSRASLPSRPGLVAAGPSNRDLDLLKERLRMRIDARPAASRSSGTDTEIVALVFRHGETIRVGINARKSGSGR